METPSSWRRISPWSVVFILAKGALRFAREHTAVIVGAGAGAAALLEGVGVRVVAAAGAAALALMVTGAWTYYLRFRYRLDGDVLRVRRGVFEVTEVELRADRIQHLAIGEPAYMRVFGLAVVTINTPGGARNEVDLPGVRRDEARALARVLAPASGAAAAEGAARAEGAASAAPARDVRFRASSVGLTLHGLASQPLLVAVAAIAPALGQLLPRLEGGLAEHAGRVFAAARGLTGSPTLAWILLAAGALFVLFAASVAVAWVQHFGYELSREGARYTQRSGLISRQEQTLSLARLQAIHWVETAIGRAIGRCYLVCRQVGSAAERQEGGNAFSIPALSRAEASRLLGEIWPGAADVGPLSRPHPRYRLAVALRLFAVVLGVTAYLAARAGDPAWLAAAAVSAPLLWPIAYLRWRAVGYRAGDRIAWVRRGLMGRRAILAPPGKAQRVAVTQSFLQRRRGLASVEITLADGPVTIPYIDAAEARTMADRILVQIETTASPL